jgi:excisionase family DNA binding protein
MTMLRSEIEPERVRKHEAASILGVPVRTVVEMAMKGRLPGAAKIGRNWTFNAARLRALVREKEIAALPKVQHRPAAARPVPKSQPRTRGAYAEAMKILSGK